ncbi:MAG: EF-P lysine aminoacylase GenX [Alphaproteobacteria bacterium]|nr:EF-P lysine aminoacylase GenX [Alphaproteobacteria bacterium]
MAEAEPAPTPWWDRGRHADRRPHLAARSRIATAARQFFAERGFVEVDPAALVASPGNETHLHAFRTDAVAIGGERQTLCLHTSPELACKKLLAAGERRIFSFGHVFRNRERGPLHSPEFTMIEWYRAEDPYDSVIADCIGLVQAAARASPAIALRHLDRKLDPFAPAERITVAAAFQRHAGIDLLACLNDRAALALAAMRAGVRAADEDTWSDIFSKVLVAKIEPQLGNGKLSVLDEYPIGEAALARPKPSDPRAAERFELYGCGVELANGFGELTDAAEQRRRFQAAMDEKEKRYGERYPIDEDFLAALAEMPPASGVALGFDRLVMLATGAARIDDVLWTPVPGHA